jgi:CheY-like chemotaxis protein
MPDTAADILIVDNDPSVRFSLCQILRHGGHSVRTAEDGFLAIQELNGSLPDILISDLNMPRMSGFELLSVVRRRFPSVYVIGMTGAFVDRLPAGIAADAFYRKATNIAKLFEMIQTGIEADRIVIQSCRESAPIWVPEVVDQVFYAKRVLIGCPECLRAFPQAAEVRGAPQETVCSHCRATINFAVVEQYA